MNQQQNNFADNLFRKTNKIIEVLGAVDKDSINVGVQKIKNDVEEYNLTYNDKIDNFTKFLNCENTIGNNVSCSYQFDNNSGRDLYIVDSGNYLWYFNNKLQKLEACSSGEEQLTLRSTGRDTAHFVFINLLYIIDNSNKLYVMGDNKKTFVKIQIGEDANISKYFVYKTSSLYIVDGSNILYVSTDGQTFEICKFGEGEGDVMTYSNHFDFNDHLYIVDNTDVKHFYVEGADNKTFESCEDGNSSQITHSNHFTFNSKLYIVDYFTNLYVSGNDKKTFNICQDGQASPTIITCSQHFKFDNRLYIVDNTSNKYLYISSDEKTFTGCEKSADVKVSCSYYFIFDNNSSLYIADTSLYVYYSADQDNRYRFTPCLISATSDNIQLRNDNNDIFEYTDGTNKYVYCCVSISGVPLYTAPLNNSGFELCTDENSTELRNYKEHFKFKNNLYIVNDSLDLYVIGNNNKSFLQINDCRCLNHFIYNDNNLFIIEDDYDLFINDTDKSTFTILNLNGSTYKSNFSYNNSLLYITDNINNLYYFNESGKNLINCSYGHPEINMTYSSHFSYNNNLYVVDTNNQLYKASSDNYKFINLDHTYSNHFDYNDSLYVADNTTTLLISTDGTTFEYCTIQGSTSTYPTYKSSFISGGKLFIINNADELMRTGYDEQPAPYSRLLVNELQEEEGTSLKALMIQLLANSNTTNTLLRELLNEMQSN